MNESPVQVLEEKIVAHCSPVLAGMKPSNMFSLQFKCQRCYATRGCSRMGALDFAAAFESCKSRLAACGLELVVLAQRERSMLLFLYRPVLLERCLGDGRVAAYLESCGYPVGAGAAACIAALCARIARSDQLARMRRVCTFPHEVGLFLGYPFDDVMGFIAHAGAGYVASGCWKVYARERDALDAFCRFDACKEEFAGRFARGERLEQLAMRGTESLECAA